MPPLFAACASADSPPEGSRTGLAGVVAPPALAARSGSPLALHRERFAAFLPRGAVTALVPEGAGLLARREPAAGRLAARVLLPRQADGATVLVDDASALQVAFTLEGATPVSPHLEDGLVVFRRGAPGGGELVHRVSAEGVEDLVLYPEPPPESALRYQVEVGRAAGLRLVSNTLEFVDAGGVPRLRVAPPWVVDAAGSRHRAALTVEGCAVDVSPVAPWGRAPVAPGAPRCRVVVRWPAGLAHPLLVDPDWESTVTGLATARGEHTATILDPDAANTEVLIVGGFDAGGEAVAAAEIYHAGHRTFSTTSALDAPRGHHATVRLENATGEVAIVVAGGRATRAGAPVDAVEVYDVRRGVFRTFEGEVGARAQHTFTALPSGFQALLVGGYGETGTPTASAVVFKFTSFAADGSVVASVTATDPLRVTARAEHVAVLLGTGNVLVAGGVKPSGAADNTAELYSSTGGTFGPAIPSGTPSPLSNVMGEQRSAAHALLLPDGDVLITGGFKGGFFLESVDRYRPGLTGEAGFRFQTTLRPMINRRASHAAVVMPSGQALVMGGAGTGGPILATEVLDPATGLFTNLVPATTPLIARSHHTATVVRAADASGPSHAAVLVVGGRAASGVLSSAQLLQQQLGEGCGAGDECESGRCVQGVCCDTDCIGACYSCRAADNGVRDGTCLPVSDGVALAPECVNNVTVMYKCNGQGSKVALDSIDCKPNTCNDEGTACEADCGSDADCFELAYCDLTTAPGSAGSSGLPAPAPLPGTPAAAARLGRPGPAFSPGPFVSAAAGAGGQAGAVGVGGAGGSTSAGGAGGAATGGTGGTTSAGGAGGTTSTGGAGGTTSTGGAAGTPAAGGAGGLATGGTGGVAAAGGTGGTTATGGAGGSTGGTGGSAATGGAGGSPASGGAAGLGGAGGGAAGLGGGAGTGGAAGTGGTSSGPRGVCMAKAPLGVSCGREGECLSGFCVDGVCCNSTCGGLCQFCEPESGQCVLVGLNEPSPPLKAGLTCAGAGTQCAGLCNGASSDVCAFPGTEAQDGASLCTCDAAFDACGVDRQLCQGDGSSATARDDCGGFRCADANTCATACVADGDCVTDHICQGGACVPLVGPLCDGDHTLRVPDAPDLDCAPYKCGGPECLATCASVDDCVAPHVCNGAGACVEPPTAGEVPGCGCRAPGEAPAPAHGAWVAAALAALAGRRRRGGVSRPAQPG